MASQKRTMLGFLTTPDSGPGTQLYTLKSYYSKKNQIQPYNEVFTEKIIVPGWSGSPCLAIEFYTTSCFHRLREKHRLCVVLVFLYPVY